MNRVRSLLSMRCILLEYSFENRINSGALKCTATAGSVMTVGFLVNECSHFQGMKRFRQNLLLSFSIKKTTKLGSTCRVTAVKMLRQYNNFDILKFLLGSDA